MTHRITFLAGAAALAFASPAAAQQSGSTDAQGGAAAQGAQTWQDVSRPSIRFVQRDGQGNVVFDSQANRVMAPEGVEDETAEAIATADGETVGATDAMDAAQTADGGAATTGTPEMEGVADAAADAMPQDGSGAASMASGTGPGQMRDGAAATADGQTADGGAATTGTPEMEGVADAAADAMPQDGAGEGSMASGSGAGQMRDGATATADAMPADGSGGASAGGERPFQSDLAQQVPGPSVPFDLDEFAQEMFEQGYRRGYVNALTQQRAALARQMRDEGRRVRGDASRPQAQDQRQGMPNAYSDGEGGTVIVLPRGMTPQQFMESLSAQR